MPRISTKSKNTSGGLAENRSASAQKFPIRESVKRIVCSREARMITGVLLALFTVIALLSCLSFLFTGAADQSVLGLTRGEQWAHRGEIHNLLGLPGARLSGFFINGSFGFLSLLIPVILLRQFLDLMGIHRARIYS